MNIARPIYLKRLLDSRNNGLLKIVTGLRRSGKSYLLKTLFREALLANNVEATSILLFDLEDRRNRRFRDPDALLAEIDHRRMGHRSCTVIIDEVQLVSEFQDVLNSLVVTPGVDVYVTGSNSRFLSSDIATEFRGRGEVIHLNPLSFSEFYSAYSGTPQEALVDYYTYGGLPQLCSLTTPESKAEYLETLCQTVYLKDIAERYSIPHVPSLITVAQVLASSIGSPISATRIANTFRSNSPDSTPSDKTISSYLRFMEEAFLVEKANRYDLKGRKYITTQPKVYYTDLGLRNAFLSFRQIEPNHLMENILYCEMRSRGYRVDVGNIPIRITSEKAQQRATVEVDFVCNRGDYRCYLQSAWSIPDDAKREQEVRPLSLLNDSFPKIIVTADPIRPTRNQNGILFLSLTDFLLKETLS